MSIRRILMILCSVLLGAIVHAQTTVTYDPGENNPNSYDSTDNPLTLSVSAGSAEQSGLLSGTGTVTKSGTGNLTLTGANTYTGHTYINGGTLAVDGTGGSISAAPTTKIHVGHVGDGTLSISSGGQVTLSSVSSFIELGHAEGVTGILNVVGTGSQVSSGWYVDVGFNGIGELNITDGGSVVSGGFTRVGVNATGIGTVLVSGAGSTLDVGSQLEIGTYGNGTVTIANGGSVSTQALHFNTLQTGTGVLNLNDGGTLSITTASGIAALNNPGDATFNLAGGTLRADASWSSSVGPILSNTSTIDTDSHTVTMHGALSGTGNLVKVGSGNLILNADNTYTGDTTISEGNLQIGNGGTTGAIASATIVNNATLTVNRSDTTTIAADISGTGSLTKTGSGNLILSGTNTYSGDTLIAGGTIEFSSFDHFGTGDITLNGGGLRWADGVTTDVLPRLGAIGPSGGGFDTNGNDVTFSTALTTANPLTKQGTGALTLSGANTAGTFAVNGGTLDLASGASLTTSTWVSLADVGGSSGQLTLTDATLDIGTDLYVGYAGDGSLTIGTGALVDATRLRLADLAAGVATVTLNPGGTLQVGGADGILAGSGTTALNFAGGTLRLNASDFTSHVPITLTGMTTFDTNGHNGGIYGSLSGTGGFTKVGAGVLTVTHANPFSGPVSVEAGTLVVNTATDLGTGNGDVTVHANAALAAATHLEFARNVTVSGSNSVIASSQYLEVGSAGDGNLTIANGGILASSTTTTLAYFSGDTGTVDATGSDSILYAQTALRVGFQGTGTLTLADGGEANAQNLILASHSGSSGTININTGGLLQVGGTNGITVSDGTGTFNLAGGTLRVGGDERVVAPPPSNEINLNDLANEIRAVIAANVPQPGDTGLTTAIPMTLSNTSTIDTNGSAAHLSGVLSGNGSLTKSGDGTLTLSGANTYTGQTSINAGTLALGEGGSLESATILLFGGATLDVSAIAFTLDSGQTLGGSGSIVGLTTVGEGAILAPGNSPGTLTFGDGLTLEGGSILNFELGTSSDLILITGGILTGPSFGTITLNITDSGGFTGGTYLLLDYSDASGIDDLDLTDFAFGSTIAGYDFSLEFFGDALQLNASVVPEPSTCAMILGLGALGCAAWRRRRNMV